MFKKSSFAIGLSLILLGILPTQTTVYAATNDMNTEDKTSIEIIEKAKNLRQTSEEEIIIIDDFEVSLGEESSTTESFSENTIQPLSTLLRLNGNVSVSRPLIGGVMTATATSTTNITAYSVNVRANVNNNGTSMTNGVWRQLSNTSFASASTKGKTRTGLGHGNHRARRTSTSQLLSVNTTNRNFQ